MSNTLEITILSAEELRMNPKHIKKKFFVCVQASDSSRGGDTWTTKMDSGGGNYPSWNEKLVIEVPVHARFITAEVKGKTAMGVTSVGTARIPVSDFTGDHVPENQLHFLSYRLWDSKCRKNGIINVSVRGKDPEQNSCSMSQTVKGVPVGDRGSSGVVNGIPLCLNHPRNF